MNEKSSSWTDPTRLEAQHVENNLILTQGHPEKPFPKSFYHIHSSPYWRQMLLEMFKSKIMHCHIKFWDLFRLWNFSVSNNATNTFHSSAAHLGHWPGNMNAYFPPFTDTHFRAVNSNCFRVIMWWSSTNHILGISLFFRPG